MPNLANFYPEPSRDAADLAPNVHALEMSKAWYERSAGAPSEYVTNEIEAYQLFTHIFQHVGTATLALYRGEDGLLTRKRVARSTTLRRPDRYTITLFETAYMDPDTREWRGVTPALGFRDVLGKPFYIHEEQALLLMDWLAFGPFLPPTLNAYKSLQNAATDFEAVINPAYPDDIDLSFPLEKQRMYTESLEMLADSLNIGRPTGANTSIMTDFIMPKVHSTAWHPN